MIRLISFDKCVNNVLEWFKPLYERRQKKINLIHQLFVLSFSRVNINSLVELFYTRTITVSFKPTMIKSDNRYSIWTVTRSEYVPISLSLSHSSILVRSLNVITCINDYYFCSFSLLMWCFFLSLFSFSLVEIQIKSLMVK